MAEQRRHPYPDRLVVDDDAQGDRPPTAPMPVKTAYAVPDGSVVPRR